MSFSWLCRSFCFIAIFDGWTTVCWRRQWHPTPVLLPGTSHGRRSLVGCSPWGREESDTTERLHFHFSLSCTGEGNGNPLQCSCLENPRDGGAWWTAVYGVSQSRTRLKQLSSSSNSSIGSKENFSFNFCDQQRPRTKLSGKKPGLNASLEIVVHSMENILSVWFRLYWLWHYWHFELYYSLWVCWEELSWAL